MCGRFVSATDADGLVRFFTIDDRQTEDLPPSWNVAPTDSVYAVTEHKQKRVLVAFRWGLVPHWADDPSIGSRLINARAENVGSKPAFRDAFARHRCLLPADGFYEWEKEPDGSRLPYFVQHPDGHPLALAGLWASWRPRDDPNAEWLRTCTIVTTKANATVSPVHSRMPVVLPPDRWDAWLDRDNDDVDELSALLLPAPDDLLVARRVSTDVNNVRNNHAELLRDPDE